MRNATGRLAGTAHVDRAHRLCLCCNSGAVGNEKHIVLECAALASLRLQYAALFTAMASADTMHLTSYEVLLAQSEHMGVFRYVTDCLDFMRVST